jgi:hypothetical protein
MRATSRLAIAAFCVIHVGLHGLLRNHPDYAFKGPVSIGLIWGAGVFGLAHLAMALVR